MGFLPRTSLQSQVPSSQYLDKEKKEKYKKKYKEKYKKL